MITLNEKGVLKAKTGQKLDLFTKQLAKVVNAKEKFLKEVKSLIRVNTWIIKNWNSLIMDMEKVAVIRREGQTSHNSLSQSLI